MMLRKRRAERGLTLLEVMVSIGILAIIGSLIYGAFDGMRRSRESITRSGDRYHEGRSALSRMSREVQSAFISLNRPEDTRLLVRQTLFVGSSRAPIDRVDFTSFSHRRTGKDSHESDQNELSYFGSRDPETGAIDLVRRVSSAIDEDAQRGGLVQVMAHDVASLDFAYLDGATDQWVEDWDSTQGLGQSERLPSQVKIVLALNRGAGEEPLVFTTKVTLGMQTPIGVANAATRLKGLLESSGASSEDETGSGSGRDTGINPFAAGADGRARGPSRSGTR